MAALADRQLLMRCVRCCVRNAAGLRQRIAKSSMFLKLVKSEGLNLRSLSERDVSESTIRHTH